jgi:hypothetical protein
LRRSRRTGNQLVTCAGTEYLRAAGAGFGLAGKGTLSSAWLYGACFVAAGTLASLAMPARCPVAPKRQSSPAPCRRPDDVR